MGNKRINLFIDGSDIVTYFMMIDISMIIYWIFFVLLCLVSLLYDFALGHHGWNY